MPSTETDTDTTSEVPAESPDTPQFETIELTGGGRRRLRTWLRPALTGVVFLLLVGVGVYAVLQEREMVSAAGMELPTITWMYGLAVLFLGLVLAGRLIATPGLARRLLGRLRSRPLVAILGGYLAVLFVVASVYPFLVSEPKFDPIIANQPPFWSSVSEAFVPRCAGPVVDGQCQGTFEHPLGTNPAGEDHIRVGLLGLNTSLRVALTASVLSATLGVLVGTLAGYRGGLTDELLMRYVDIQRALPAFFLYILLTLIFGVTYELMILVFGLLSWGGIARLVRSEVTQLKTTAYVSAAELSGARSPFVLVRHVLPNASNTIFTAATLLFAKFVVYEAALSYLTLTDGSIISLGNEIAAGVGAVGGRPLYDFWFVPWVVYVPAGLLCSFLLAVSAVGDGLRDVVDPRE